MPSCLPQFLLAKCVIFLNTESYSNTWRLRKMDFNALWCKDGEVVQQSSRGKKQANPPLQVPNSTSTYLQELHAHLKSFSCAITTSLVSSMEMSRNAAYIYKGELFGSVFLVITLSNASAFARELFFSLSTRVSTVSAQQLIGECQRRWAAREASPAGWLAGWRATCSVRNRDG